MAQARRQVFSIPGVRPQVSSRRPANCARRVPVPAAPLGEGAIAISGAVGAETHRAKVSESRIPNPESRLYLNYFGFPTQ